MNTSWVAEKRAPQVDDARAFLAKHHCISLATNGPAGLWASTVFYVNRGFELYFLSGAATRHARNIEAAPQLAATINDDVEDWQAIRGVQLEGRAERVDDSRRGEVLQMFSLRYPFPEMFWWAEDGTVPRAEQRIYRIRPSRLLFYNHRLSEGRLEVPAELLRCS
jgi:uncharacterized protein YhbP (UPF0306 family)